MAFLPILTAETKSGRLLMRRSWGVAAVGERRHAAIFGADRIGFCSRECQRDDRPPQCVGADGCEQSDVVAVGQMLELECRGRVAVATGEGDRVGEGDGERANFGALSGAVVDLDRCHGRRREDVRAESGAELGQVQLVDVAIVIRVQVRQVIRIADAAARGAAKRSQIDLVVDAVAITVPEQPVQTQLARAAPEKVGRAREVTAWCPLASPSSAHPRAASVTADSFTVKEYVPSASDGAPPF